MKLVILDGYTANPGDLSWEPLREFGSLEVYDKTPDELILQRSEGAGVLLTNKTPLRRKTLEALPDCRYIGELATGYDNLDLEAAARLGITVTNIPAYSTDSVAQTVFALLFELATGAGLHSCAVREGQWSAAQHFSFWLHPLTELAGKTFGLVGFGNIGRKVAQIAEAFGMDCLVYSRSRRDLSGFGRTTYADSIDQVFSQADVVSLHCPMNDETALLANQVRLSLMKPSAFFLNTARGGLVVEQDLADALNSGTIAGAGLDVLSAEPPNRSNPLLTAKNCVITPHIAWATQEARGRLVQQAIQNVRSFLKGTPINVISPPSGR
ncbi:MAG: D-2-hydroxyacid dehydrogenase [Christensenellales bacterium]|jgi:glycerate dehydrogenase